MNAKQKIIDRIDMMESKDVFIANDFFDIAGYETIISLNISSILVSMNHHQLTKWLKL